MNIELRWLVVKRHVTAQDVLAERSRTGDTLLECKKRLEARQAPVLQYRGEEESHWNGPWTTIPTVVEEPKT